MTDILIILFKAVAVVLAVTFHEFSHAFVADRLGDYTPRAMGRVTLNPVAHFDLFGAILFFLTLMGVSPFAYGKPVQVNPLAFKKVTMRRGMLLVSFAGPAANFLLALLFSLLLRVLPSPSMTDLSTMLFYIIIVVNVYLGLFNLLPIYPLDGEKILVGLLPHEQAQAFERLRQYQMIFIILIIFNAHYIISPIASFILSLLL